MLKAIITDVDGVVTGSKKNYNTPLPPKHVIQALHTVRRSGISVILCTGKWHIGVDKIIRQAELDNPHITGGGALIIDPLDSLIVKKHFIDKKIVSGIFQSCIDNNIYLEAYSIENYFVSLGHTSEIAKQREFILQKKPILSRNILHDLLKQEILTINVYAKDVQEKKLAEGILLNYEYGSTRVWSLNPLSLPTVLCNVTGLNVSKKHSAEEVISALQISYDEVLGIGDTEGDWKFMQLFGFSATLDNADKELKKLVSSRNGFIGRDVNQDGILDIFRHFGLIGGDNV